MRTDDPRHGTTRGYHQGCRCIRCRRAIADYEKRGRLNRAQGTPRAVPAIGAQRRLQALLALGWSSTAIATTAGWPHRNHVQRILYGQNGRPCTWLEAGTHVRVVRVYDSLSMRVPPTTPMTERTRRYAARKGYAPPLAWDEGTIDNPDAEPQGHVTGTGADAVVVERILAGEWQLPAQRAERLEVVARWMDDGGTQNELERHTGWNVSRMLRQMREDGAA